MATSPITYFTQIRDEMQRVTYPSRQEVVRLTIIVIAVSIALALFLAGLDYVFGQGITLLLKVKP